MRVPIYIDLKNFISLALSCKPEGPCVFVLKCMADMFFNFTKEELKNAIPQGMEDSINRFTELFSQEVESDQIYKGEKRHPEEFPFRPLKTNMHATFHDDQLQSLFLLEDQNVDVVKKAGLLLVSEVGNEVVTINKLFMDKYFQFAKPIDITGMQNWNPIKEVTAPCTDIIISDQFICADEYLSEDNVTALLSVLTSYAGKESAVNIIIITLKEFYNSTTKTTYKPNWKNLADNITKKLKKCNGINARITFVVSREKFEHDRTIFTNYRLFSPGDSTTYFNSDEEKITKGRYFHTYSVAHPSANGLIKTYLKDMQKHISNLEQKNNPELIVGKKKSNFLKFS